MRIYTVISYDYSGCDNEINLQTHGAFKTMELASAFMKKTARDYYEQWFDPEEYKYDERNTWCEISNGDFIGWDSYNFWYRAYQVKECDFFDADIIIKNN